MLRITTPSGDLRLSPDIEIPITLTNPMFNDRGSYSLPFTVPLKPNIDITGNAINPNNKSITSKFIDVTIEQKQFIEKGALYLTDISDNELQYSLTTREGAFWEWAKETSLTALDFPDSDPFTGTINEKLNLWKQRIIDCHDKVWPQEYFNAFPVVVSMETDAVNEVVWGTGIASMRIVNKIDPQTGLIEFNGLGYAWEDVSPYMYLNALIFLVAQKYGFRVDNELERDEEMNRACIVNNATIPIINGVIDWPQLVPDITVMDLIEIMESSYGAIFYCDYKRKILKVLTVDSVLNKESVVKINGKVKVMQNDALQINLKSDAAAGDYGNVVGYTDEYFENLGYPVTEIYESILNGTILGEADIPNFSNTKIVYVKSMESYFFLHYTRENETETWKLTLTFLGNRLRDYVPESDLDMKEFSAKAVVLPMVHAFIKKATIENYWSTFSYTFPHFAVALKEPYTNEFDFASFNTTNTFPFNIVIYRGKHYNGSIVGWEHFFPWGSSFIYSYDNDALNNLPVEQSLLFNDTLSLIKNGKSPDSVGVFERFWAKTEQFFLHSAKYVIISNVKVEDILSNNIWDIFDIDGNHIIFTEVKLTLTRNSIRFDSAKGITTKPYV